MNRRALLGVGVFGVSIAATLGAVALRGEQPERDERRRPGRLDGLAPEPIAALLHDEDVRAALWRQGVRLDDVESAPLGEGAYDTDGADYLVRAFGPAAAADGRAYPPLFTSPLVLHARPAVAAQLEQRGLLQRDGARAFVATDGLLRSDLPFALGDPTDSDAAWLFAGLAATTLGGEAEALAALRPRVDEDDSIEEFLDADPYARPARVGFESDLYAAAAAEPGEWAQLQASRPDAAPLTLYLRPTVYALWTFVGLRPSAQPLAAALLSPQVQSMAQLRHGLRGPQRQSGVGESFQQAGRLPPPPTEVAALPDPSVVQRLARQLAD